MKSKIATLTTLQPIELSTSNSDDLTGALLSVYSTLKADVKTLKINPSHSNRLTSKIDELACAILLQHRYFKVISTKFEEYSSTSRKRRRDESDATEEEMPALSIDTKSKITAPMVSSDAELGLIMTPSEITTLLSDSMVDYTNYLLALLQLIDVIVDYTSEVIIKVSINKTDKFQYSLALINSQLLTKLQAGFQLLDLKNDNLRRKYDGLKYLVKKMNSMVYDLSLRNLIEADASVV